jgi:hypothetical protein
VPRLGLLVALSFFFFFFSSPSLRLCWATTADERKKGEWASNDEACAQGSQG